MIPNLLCYIQTISIKASNSVCSTPHYQPYNVHSYEPKKLVDLLHMSPHSKMYDLTESFACRVHNFYIEIIKQIHACNEQYKFRAYLHKCHNALNV